MHILLYIEGTIAYSTYLYINSLDIDHIVDSRNAIGVAVPYSTQTSSLQLPSGPSVQHQLPAVRPQHLLRALVRPHARLRDLAHEPRRG